MNRYRILELCARIECHNQQRKLLRESCQGFDDWKGLLNRAEREGMAPLLKKHLSEAGIEVPGPIRRSLKVLGKRHQQQAGVRIEVLKEVLQHFTRNGFTTILIKGAALCQTLYPHPELRPMRDMDLLLAGDEVDRAQELLRDLGYEQSKAPIPPDHYHLPSLHTVVDDVKICFELHRGLYPNCPPWYPQVDFKRLLERGRKIQVGSVEVSTFNHDETLHYLYQHGFRTPLTYEPYKLVNAADLIGYVEKYYSEINWQKVRAKWPLVVNALHLMEHISPWNRQEIPADIAGTEEEKDCDLSTFTGWPHRRLKEFKAEGVSQYNVLKATFFPPLWWTGLFYGVKGRGGYLKAIAVKHPRQIMWWKRLYSFQKRNNS